MADVPQIKLVLVGRSAVGKTCIVQVGTTGIFDIDVTPTLGAAYTTKSVFVNDTDVRIQIWDTAGQERYRGMTPMYYRGAHAALIVYSITDEKSFDEIDKWVESLNENVDSDVRLFLVGNKIDLENERKVTQESGQSKAKSIDAQFMEVSARTGSNIEELFILIAKQITESNHHNDIINVIDPKPDNPVEPVDKKCC